MSDAVSVELTVNGRQRRLDVAPHHTLLEVLRDDLELTGAKECCLVGECGACTVRLDGRIVDSCLVLAVEADGGEVTTVEGLAPEGTLDPLQQAFLDEGGVQCGFCIPGQVMAADDLLAAHPAAQRGTGRGGPGRQPLPLRLLRADHRGCARCGPGDRLVSAVAGVGESVEPGRRRLRGSAAGSATWPTSTCPVSCTSSS